MSGDTIFREYRISDAERSDRSAGDRLRHRQKVRESIRENIADIIAEESIIGKDKDRVIKVPLREILSEFSSHRKGYRKVGIRIRLDKRRTAKQRVIRMLASDKRHEAAAR